MKKLFFIGLATLAIGSATLTSCGKYPEGPGFALSSKKARLAGDWKLSAKTQNSVDILQTGYTEELIINKDGSFIDTAKLVTGPFTYVGDNNGSWSFSEDKMQLMLNATKATTPLINGVNTFDIVKLTSKELILSKTNASIVTVLTFVPKN
jgi:hypothetical protein